MTDTPMVPLSWGETLDKITILQIKDERLDDNAKRANVRKELDLLTAIAAVPLADAVVAPLIARLKAINAQLWEIEDHIRDKERAKAFDQDFIALARSVYQINDQRAAVKRDINLALKSGLVEEKSYKPY